MSSEIDNILDTKPKLWGELDKNPNSGKAPENLVRAQLARARNEFLVGGFSCLEQVNNGELTAKMDKALEDPKPESFRNLFSVQLNHLKLIMLGGNATFEEKTKLQTIEKFLATLPLEPKLYPSDRKT